MGSVLDHIIFVVFFTWFFLTSSTMIKMQDCPIPFRKVKDLGQLAGSLLFIFPYAGSCEYEKKNIYFSSM